MISTTLTKEEYRKLKRDTFEALKDIPPVELLFHESKREFAVNSEEEVLGKIIDDHNVITVVGGYFGDEGKGKTISAIAKNPKIKIVGRFNSGENAGHTVVWNGKKYVFNLTPSGILIPGKINVIGPECVMDPINYLDKEIKQLVDAGIDYKDRLFVGNVQLVLPHYKIMDFAFSPPNTSTLMGMSYAHAAKVMKKGLKLDHIFNSRDNQEKRLKSDLETYQALLAYKKIEEQKILDDLEGVIAKGERKIPYHLIEFLKVKDKVEFILDLYKKRVVENSNFPKRTDVSKLVRDVLEEGGKLLAEGSQSSNLGNNTEKFTDSGTSAQTNAAGVEASANYDTQRFKSARIVTFKTPGDSRVGDGGNPSSFVYQKYFSDKGIDSLKGVEGACEDFDEIQRIYFKSIQSNGILNPVEYCDKKGEMYLINEAMAIASAVKFGEKGATTGKPRITGLFDCLSAKQVCGTDGGYITISAVDRGDNQDFVGLTVAYIYHHPKGEVSDSNGTKYHNGDIIRVGDPYPCEQVLRFCHPIIKVMPGWKDTPIGVGKRNPNDPLPENTQKFIGTIEDIVGRRIISMGNGPDTKDLIYLERAS